MKMYVKEIRPVDLGEKPYLVQFQCALTKDEVNELISKAQYGYVDVQIK